MAEKKSEKRNILPQGPKTPPSSPLTNSSEEECEILTLNSRKQRGPKTPPGSPPSASGTYAENFTSMKSKLITRGLETTSSSLPSDAEPDKSAGTNHLYSLRECNPYFRIDFSYYLTLNWHKPALIAALNRINKPQINTGLERIAQNSFQSPNYEFKSKIPRLSYLEFLKIIQCSTQKQYEYDIFNKDLDRIEKDGRKFKKVKVYDAVRYLSDSSYKDNTDIKTFNEGDNFARIGSFDSESGLQSLSTAECSGLQFSSTFRISQHDSGISSNSSKNTVEDFIDISYKSPEVTCSLHKNKKECDLFKSEKNEKRVKRLKVHDSIKCLSDTCSSDNCKIIETVDKEKYVVRITSPSTANCSYLQLSSATRPFNDDHKSTSILTNSSKESKTDLTGIPEKSPKVIILHENREECDILKKNSEGIRKDVNKIKSSKINRPIRCLSDSDNENDCVAITTSFESQHSLQSLSIYGCSSIQLLSDSGLSQRDPRFSQQDPTLSQHVPRFFQHDPMCSLVSSNFSNDITDVSEISRKSLELISPLKTTQNKHDIFNNLDKTGNTAKCIKKLKARDSIKCLCDSSSSDSCTAIETNNKGNDVSKITKLKYKPTLHSSYIDRCSTSTAGCSALQLSCVDKQFKQHSRCSRISSNSFNEPIIDLTDVPRKSPELICLLPATQNDCDTFTYYLDKTEMEDRKLKRVKVYKLIRCFSDSDTEDDNVARITPPKSEPRLRSFSIAECSSLHSSSTTRCSDQQISSAVRSNLQDPRCLQTLPKSFNESEPHSNIQHESPELNCLLHKNQKNCDIFNKCLNKNEKDKKKLKRLKSCNLIRYLNDSNNEGANAGIASPASEHIIQPLSSECHVPEISLFPRLSQHDPRCSHISDNSNESKRDSKFIPRKSPELICLSDSSSNGSCIEIRSNLDEKNDA